MPSEEKMLMELADDLDEHEYAEEEDLVEMTPCMDDDDSTQRPKEQFPYIQKFKKVVHELDDSSNIALFALFISGAVSCCFSFYTYDTWSSWLEQTFPSMHTWSMFSLFHFMILMIILLSCLGGMFGAFLTLIFSKNLDIPTTLINENLQKEFTRFWQFHEHKLSSNLLQKAIELTNAWGKGITPAQGRLYLIINDIQQSSNEYDAARKAANQKVMATVSEEVKVAPTQTMAEPLPLEAQEIVQSIKSIHAHLALNQLNIHEQLTVANIMEKKLPETLQSYFNVKKEYRTQFKNSQGKNANELLMTSLQNMRDKMEKVSRQHHYDNFLKLDANTRYTKAMNDD